MRLRRSLVGLAASFVVAWAPAASPASAVATTHTIHGTVVVRGGVSLRNCAGADDQSDIHEGTHVRLRDDERRVIARATLGAGRAGGGGIDRCLLRFTMRDVASSPTYSFVVADRPGGRTFTRAQLARREWRVTLTPT